MIINTPDGGHGHNLALNLMLLYHEHISNNSSFIKIDKHII